MSAAIQRQIDELAAREAKLRAARLASDPTALQNAELLRRQRLALEAKLEAPERDPNAFTFEFMGGIKV